MPIIANNTGGGGGSSSKFGVAEIDFGANPSSETSLNITGLTSIKSNSVVNLFIQSASTTDNTITDHKFASVALRLVASDIIEGVGFTINAYCIIGEATGKFKIQYNYL